MPDQLGSFTVDDARKIARLYSILSRQPLNRERPEPQRNYAPPGITFKNNSGQQIPPYSAMLVTDVQIRSDGTLIYQCTQPNTTFSRTYLLNGPRAIDAGKNGQAQVGPVYRADYDSGTPVNGEIRGPKPGQWPLSKGFSGFRVEGLDTDNELAIVRFEPIVELYGYATGSIAANATSTAYKIYTGTLGSEADGGWTTVPSALNGGTALVNNDKIGLSLVASGWLMGKRC